MGARFSPVLKTGGNRVRLVATRAKKGVTDRPQGEALSISERLNFSCSFLEIGDKFTESLMFGMTDRLGTAKKIGFYSASPPSSRLRPSAESMLKSRT